MLFALATNGCLCPQTAAAAVAVAVAAVAAAAAAAVTAAIDVERTGQWLSFTRIWTSTLGVSGADTRV